jgi:hypothetical protein
MNKSMYINEIDINKTISILESINYNKSLSLNREKFIIYNILINYIKGERFIKIGEF